jgi:hypothetical protein
MAALAHAFDGRPDDVDLLAAEMAAFARMRIESGDSDPRSGKSET